MAWLTIPIAYVLGAVPMGYLIGRYYGVNVLGEGSGNIGATNVARLCGPRAAAAAFVLDVLKGLVPVVLARWWAPQAHGLHVLAGLSALVGHTCSVFLKGRGGKGVSTSLGMALGLSPVAALVGFGVWLIVVGFVGYASLASIVGVAAATLVLWPISPHWSYLGAFVASLIMVTVRHRANIGRLLRGEEPRIGGGRTAPAPSPPGTEPAAPVAEPASESSVEL